MHGLVHGSVHGCMGWCMGGCMSRVVLNAVLYYLGWGGGVVGRLVRGDSVIGKALVLYALELHYTTALHL